MWLPWVSRRFLVGRKGGRGRLVFIFALVLISAGVGTLNTILAVMNGLQQGYIRSILEIGSYHLRWNSAEVYAEGAEAAGNGTGSGRRIASDKSTASGESAGLGKSTASGESAGLERPVAGELRGENHDSQIADIIGVLAADPATVLVTPFREGQTMLTGLFARPAGALVRGLPESAFREDEGLRDNLFMIDGTFNIEGRGVVLGIELARKLGVAAGDVVNALDLGTAGLTAVEEALEVTGVFQCGYREYESVLAFVSLDTSARILGSRPVDLGIKLKKVDRDRAFMNRVLPGLEGFPGELLSWRETNRSFFGALRTEKMMLLLLLALIFVVVAVNIDHSLRRMATERTEDLALLKALGASPRDVRLLFLRYGLVIGGSGGLLGSALGVLVGANVERIISFFTGGHSASGYSSFGGGGLGAFFRSSEVMPADVITIFFLALILSGLSAIRAASMAARLQPAQVLRSE